MISYKDDSLFQYLEKLSFREPVPGGGSAAALVGGMGAALLAMSARYSVGKGKPVEVDNKINDIIARVDAARLTFIDLAGQDASAYKELVRTRKAGDPAAYEKAQVEASRIPQDIIDLCEACLNTAPYLVQEGNPHLVSDVKAAEAFLNAGIAAAKHMQEANA
jgi:methenyltetrahydrofolate cyclohydrolase